MLFLLRRRADVAWVGPSLPESHALKSSNRVRCPCMHWSLWRDLVIQLADTGMPDSPAVRLKTALEPTHERQTLLLLPRSRYNTNEARLPV